MACQLAEAYDKAMQNPIIKEIETQEGIETVEKIDGKILIDNLSKQLSADEIQIKITKSTPKFILATLFIALIVAGYYYTTRKKYINGKEFGSAEWASPKIVEKLLSRNIRKEVVKAIKKDKRFRGRRERKGRKERKKAIREAKEKYANSSDILLTKKIGLSLYHKDSLNNNVLLVAGSGSGKTTGFVLPNILQASTSKYSPAYVITDPKGEILEEVGWFLRHIGYHIGVLNIKDMQNSLHYNPFKYVRLRENDADMQAQIRKIAAAIIEYQADAEAQKGEAIWPEMAIDCLYSIFLATYYGFPESERTINTGIELFGMLDIEEDEREFNCDLDIFFKLYEKRFANNEAALSASRNYWQFRKKCRGRTGQSALATIRPKIAAFENENVKRIFSSDDLELEKLGEDRRAIFVVLPPMEKQYNFIANLMYIQMFDIIEYNATVKHENRLPVSVRFILDEFYNTGKIPSFDNILSYARGFGVSVALAIQSIEQIKAMYPKTWGIIVDNCSSFLYLGGLKHVDGLEYISKILGKGTFDKKTSSRTKGIHNSSNTDNSDRFGRELLDAAELGRIHPRKCVLALTGYNPFYEQKNYFKYHPNYKYTLSANRKHIFKLHIPKTDEEKAESPHREELYPETSVKQTTLEGIKTEFDTDKVYQYMRAKVLSYDFDNDENIYIDEGEIEQISDYIEQEKQAVTEKQEFISKMKGIEMIPLTEEKIKEISAETEKGNVQYDEVFVDEGEILELEEVENTFDDISEILSDLQEDSIFNIQDRLERI